MNLWEYGFWKGKKRHHSPNCNFNWTTAVLGRGLTNCILFWNTATTVTATTCSVHVMYPLILVTVPEQTQYNSWMGLCKITLSQVEKKETHLRRHISAIQTPLIFLASRWEFGIIEFWEARRTSYPAPFTVLSQTDVICPISWMNGSAPDATALPRICVQQRGSTLLSCGLLIWVLDLGHGFMRRCTISGPYISPRRLEAGFWISDELWVKSAAEFSRATKAVSF